MSLSAKIKVEVIAAAPLASGNDREIVFCRYRRGLHGIGRDRAGNRRARKGSTPRCANKFPQLSIARVTRFMHYGVFADAQQYRRLRPAFVFVKAHTQQRAVGVLASFDNSGFQIAARVVAQIAERCRLRSEVDCI